MKVHHSVIMRPFFPNCSQVEQYPEQCGIYRYVHVFVYIDSGNSQSVYIFKVIDALAVYCYLNSIVCKRINTANVIGQSEDFSCWSTDQALDPLSPFRNSLR